jgi:hypothetical protein
MARVSFTLRKVNADKGSYLQYESGFGSRTDTDYYLRQDGLQFPPAQQGANFLEATCTKYGTVDLRWNVSDIYQGELGGVIVPANIPATPTIIGISVRYSPYGEPETVESGVALFSETRTTFSHSHLVAEGKWAYYSLFAHYASTDYNDNYYTRLASIKILPPKNYGSVQVLWNRIPEFYRSQDAELGNDLDYFNAVNGYEDDYVDNILGGLPSYVSKVGPLYRFLSVFGFEMDRVRTIIDYIEVSKDPMIADSEVLSALSIETGVNLLSSDLGAERLRKIINDIGYFNRSKGTKESLSYIAKAIANSDVDVDYANGEINVYAQRVNYVPDPKNMASVGLLLARPAHYVERERLQPIREQGTFDPTAFSQGSSATYPQPATGTTYRTGMWWTCSAAGTFDGFTVDSGDIVMAYGTGTTWDTIEFHVYANGIGATNYGSNTSYTQTNNEFSYSNTGASVGITHALMRANSPVPVKLGDKVCFSVHSTQGVNYRVGEILYSTIHSARVVDASGNHMGWASTPTPYGGTSTFEVKITDNASETDWTIGYLEFLVDMELVDDRDIGPFKVSKVLIERNHVGSYFDGDKELGNWIFGASSSIKDYRWLKNADASLSVYTEDFGRTRSTVGTYIPYSLPITQVDRFTVSDYSYVGGKDLIEALAPNTTDYIP